MASTFQLRADETILFQGDVSHIKSLASIKEGSDVVTNLRCIFEWSGQSFIAEKLEAFKHGQTNWRKNVRDSCADAACLGRAYQERQRELK